MFGRRKATPDGLIHESDHGRRLDELERLERVRNAKETIPDEKALIVAVQKLEQRLEAVPLGELGRPVIKQVLRDMEQLARTARIALDLMDGAPSSPLEEHRRYEAVRQRQSAQAASAGGTLAGALGGLGRIV